MTANLVQLVQIQYRYNHPAGFLTLWPKGTLPDRLQEITTSDWVVCTCQQWFAHHCDQAELENEIFKHLSQRHPTAQAVELLAYRVLRQDNQFLSW